MAVRGPKAQALAADPAAAAEEIQRRREEIGFTYFVTRRGLRQSPREAPGVRTFGQIPRAEALSTGWLECFGAAIG
ncbi:hypothetical protein FHX82_001817 [Amycolatopsis bartoniae]|uniref:Uncharacterized protein n=1 Tax=Amycolatopsis bartoniae TaxID=941986 RepID=A0A8H9IPP2_9PSEU|nr:hypothetical protein [Amycolatopsis bartoniae]MBB2934797.1 hypothetical protein [Amycolatopsis bartoniae]TVT02417.1 hypothetical protein FNH07_27265 [Amycolatopsis bartoniae]GHF44667.1 hypothetical protein GCM10017566_17090 [Amycolatopsis bartoniae]